MGAGAKIIGNYILGINKAIKVKSSVKEHLVKSIWQCTGQQMKKWQ